MLGIFFQIRGRKSLIPVRRGFQLDLNRFRIRLDVVPFSERVPAFRDYLNQNFALWEVGNLHRAVLIGLKAHFSELVLVKQTYRFVEADVDAGVTDGLSIWSRNFDPQLDRAGIR